MPSGVYIRTEYHKSCLRSWNKDLTKETDPRVKKNGEAIKEAFLNIPEETREKLREGGRRGVKFAEGWNLGLTKETDPRVAKNAENIKVSWNSKSDEEMKIISENRIGKPSPLGSGRSHGDYYITPLQGYKWLRSSYEIALAEYLDQHNILWYYESIKFKIKINGTDKQTSYTPDFFLPEFNKFIEVKGYLYPRDKLKIEKFYRDNSYYLEVLFEEDLKNLGINLKYYIKKKPKKSNQEEISYESLLTKLFEE